MARKPEAKPPRRRTRLVPFASIMLALLFPLSFAANARDPGYVQQGEASWYGKPFHGRKTASGERYNMYEMSCAHRTLPFGTRLKVTNLNTGESVIVTVNDRGPYARGRIIDLSFAAAQEISMIGTGVAQVRIEILGPDLIEPAEPEPEPIEPEPEPVPVQQRERITVLSFNIFDPFFGPHREERVVAVPSAIMALEPRPDVIVLIEAFQAQHREFILRELANAGYPVAASHYEKRGYGTGIFIISRFPISKVEYTPFRVGGAFFDAERYAGKGVVHLRLVTGEGPLEIFATHPIARFKKLYNKQGKHQDRDRKTIDRLLEMDAVARIIAGQADPRARSVILAGDLNVSPDMWEYQYLRARAGLDDSYDACHPGEPASTYSDENTFNDTDWSRIDHVLYRNRPGDTGFWVAPDRSSICIRDTITLPSGTRTCLSDHFGVLSSFTATTEPEGVPMSPEPIGPSHAVGRSAADLSDGKLRLTPDNRAAWQAWAVDIMDSADRAYNRFDERVIPAARIIIAGHLKEPVEIPLSPAQRMLLRAGLVGK